MSDSDEVMQVEREWTEAHRVGDVAVIDRLMAEDFVRINSDGSKVHRAEALASYADGKKTWDFAEGSEYDIRIYGETALVFVRWTARGFSHEQRFDYAARILSVYHRRKGRWQMVAEQSTLLPSGQK